MGIVFVVNRVERHVGAEIKGVFDSLDKARAYRRSIELDLEESHPNNITTTFEIEEWDVL